MLNLLKTPKFTPLASGVKALLCLLLTIGNVGLAVSAPKTLPGTVIENTASARWQQVGEDRNTESNTVETTTTIFQTTAEIQFLRLSNTAGDNSQPSEIENPECSDGNDNYSTSAPATARNGQAVDDNANLAPATTYVHGDPVYFEVADADQNIDDEVRDTVLVTITTDNGDEETLRIYETGPDTGVFAGYIQSEEGPVTQHDCVLSVVRNTQISIYYVDRFDATEERVASALIDPYGIVFDSRTGTPRDGIRVTLMDVGTGAPATVFADDGVTPWPSTVVTGDASLDFGQGEYRFPLVNEGEYRLELEPSSVYAFPSTLPPEQLPNNSLNDEPYTVVIGSYGENFLVPEGPPVRVDVPIDPLLQELVLEKTAQRTVVQQGDFLKFTLNLMNASAELDARDIHIIDTLPLGLRYQKGSSRLNGVAALDPAIAPNGREVSFEVGDLDRGDSLSLSYVVRITSGAVPGEAINRAMATANGGLLSNEAEAVIQIEAAFQQGTMTLVGRVMDTDCSEEDRPARPVAGVRVYLENGRYAVTDEDGKYHFEGLTARSHVVQLDQATLPPQFMPQLCYDDTRYAGTATSRFVDAQQASLWRADFYVKEKQPKRSTVGIRLRSAIEQQTLKYNLQLAIDEVAVKDAILTLMLPDGVTPVVGSAKLDGEPVRIRNRAGVVNIRLPEVSAKFETSLTLEAEVDAAACNSGTVTSSAMATFGTELRKRNRTAVVHNTVACTQTLAEPESYVYRPQFDVLRTVLKPADLMALHELATRLNNRPLLSVEVHGYADSDLIPQRNQHLFANNLALSKARAQAVAHELARALQIDPNRINVEGMGSAKPVASNATEAGKAMNRRVEIHVYAEAAERAKQLQVLEGDSGFQTVIVEEQNWEAKSLWEPSLYAQMQLSDLDAAWLERKDSSFELVLPTEGYNPAGISIPIAVKHPPQQRVLVELNGQAVSPLNFDSLSRSRNQQVALSRWKGVDIPAGDNELVVHLLNANGDIERSIQRTVRRSTSPVIAEIDKQRSRLAIDGHQGPVIAVQLRDASGAPIARGVTGAFKVLSAHQTIVTAQDQAMHGHVNGNPVANRYVVADDSGTAFIQLAPTAQPGRVILAFEFGDGRRSEIEAWVSEQPRDWILVGLAEGSLSQQAPAGSVRAANNDEVFSDGRLAFFAKGRVLGSALLTMRYDSELGEAQQFGHGASIDPNAWYTLYGDQSLAGQDAASQKRIYVRLEREAFHATYGDFTTDLNIVELATYQRSLTGLKSELRGRYVSYNLFAAETETGFVRDEIPGDGTSGVYRLSQLPELNTDTLRLETRDRLRSHEVVETQLLRRYQDYQIDYDQGTVFFRQPIPSRDAELNPVYIVAEYEVAGDGNKVTTVGGRVALHNASQRLTLGASYISEREDLSNRSVIAIDGRIRLGQFTELVAEVGETRSDATGVDTVSAGRVFEIRHQGHRLNGSVYFRELEAGYGLGSVSGSEDATRKVGLQADIGLHQQLSVTLDAAEETNLTQGNQRRHAGVGLRYHNTRGHVELGLRHAEDETAAGQLSESQQAILDVRQSFFNNFVGISARYEAALADKNAASDFPDRVVLGLDVRVAPATLLFVKQEYTEGAARDTRTTRLGIESELWKGASLQSYIAEDDGDNGPRLYSGNGFTQQFSFRQNWWTSVGFDHATTLRNVGATPLNNNTPLASGPNGDDFKSGHISFGRKGELWHWDIRFEAHRSSSRKRNGLISSWRRQNREGKGIDFSLRWLRADNGDSQNDKAEAQLSLVWRPIEAKWFFFNRLDLIAEREEAATTSEFRSTRLVNQFNANWLPNTQNQLSLFLGVKYVEDVIDGDVYDGAYSQLGMEYRYSFNEWWDWGLQLSSHNDWQASNRRYSAGLNVGVSPLQNLWVTVGYNWAGFDDQDFDEAAWTNHGAYLKFRLKFDQLGNGANFSRHQAMSAREQH